MRLVSAEFRWVPLSSVAASHDITSRCHPRATEDHLGRPKRRPRANPEPSRGGPGAPRRPLERPGGRKTPQKRYTVDDVWLFGKTRLRSRKERSKSRPGRHPRGPRRLPGRPKSAPGGGSSRPFWIDFGPSVDHFGPNFDRCQHSSIFAAIFLSIFAGPGQSHAGRPDVQSTCPTNCRSRPATVERSIITRWHACPGSYTSIGALGVGDSEEGGRPVVQRSQ